MWLLLGIMAIGATTLNLYRFKIGKDYRLAMALGLSLTALTLTAQYSSISMWVEKEDWAALMDVVPTMSSALWILTLISISLNFTPLILDKKMKANPLFK